MYQNESKKGLQRLSKIFLLSAFLMANVVIIEFNTDINSKLIGFSALWFLTGFALKLESIEAE